LINLKTQKKQVMETTVQTTETKRGRKVNPNSARQVKLSTRAALAEQGMTIQRGRKPNANSERQQRLASFAERIANGEVIKRGRPKKVATTEVA
jgi:hypothetical protein